MIPTTAESLCIASAFMNIGTMPIPNNIQETSGRRME
jgi:hypothetical protein